MQNLNFNKLLQKLETRFTNSRLFYIFRFLKKHFFKQNKMCSLVGLKAHNKMCYSCLDQEAFCQFWEKQKNIFDFSFWRFFWTNSKCDNFLEFDSASYSARFQKSKVLHHSVLRHISWVMSRSWTLFSCRAGHATTLLRQRGHVCRP